MKQAYRAGAATAVVAFLLAAAAAAQAPGTGQEGSAVPAAAAAAKYGVVQAEKGPYLVGEVTRADVLEHFPAWLDTARAYAPDSALVAALAAVPQPVEIVCVMGTWCSDSRREVPRFWQLLDLAGNPNLTLRMLAVGRKDDQAAEDAAEAAGCPRDIRSRWDVTLVPTFIFRAGEEEVGRIVETPQVSLEADAAAILGGAGPATGPGGWR